MSDFLKMKESIIKRAEADLDFRKELKEDPKGAIEKYFPHEEGKKIPEKINLVVCEDSENTIYLNIAPDDFHTDAY